MASARELIVRAISRAEEIGARPRVDWTVAKNWAGDTIEVLEGIYGEAHHKVALFRDAGQPGAVRLIRHGPPPDPTPAVKRRVAAQLTVLREFVQELEETEQAPRLFNEAARARLWHLVTDLFPSTQYSELAEPVTMYQEDLEEYLHRRLDRVKLAPGRDAEARLQTFILRGADDSTLQKAVESLPEAYAAVHQIDHHQRDRLVPEAITALNGYLESIGHELRFDSETYELKKPGLDTAAPRGFRALPNADVLSADLAAEIGRQDRPTAVIAFDLDGFKAVNDRGGHQEAGDACLQRVVDITGKIVDGRGKLYRPGGDEFVIVLPNTTSAEAAATAERIRRAIEGADLARALDLSVTTSIGVACSEDKSDPKDLLSAADDAAYTSKFSGKNRVTTWPLDEALAREVSAKRSQAQGR